MDAFLAALVVAGLILAVWGWNRLKATTRKKLNQSVFQRKGHEQGQRITSEQLAIRSSAEPKELLSVVRDRLDLATTPGPLPRLFLANMDEGALVFAQGSKLGENFRAALTLESSDGGTTGNFVVLNWTEVDGIVGHLDDLEYLRRAVQNAVLQVDPEARFEVAHRYLS